MDLNITINNAKFDYKLYDKRDTFPFYIIQFPHLCSNIPRKIVFASIQTEILRICRDTAQFDYFIYSCDPFLNRMVKQGAKKVDLTKPQHKIIYGHLNEFSKYQFNTKHILKEILKLI